MTRPPRTQKQIEASRANGAKSRGPKTPQGKQISAANAAQSTGPVTPLGKAISARNSRNARRHSLLAASIVLPSEAQSGFKTILDELYDELQPETTIECQLVEVMAVASWRRQRMWCFEMGQVAHAVLAQQRIEDPALESEAAQIPALPSAIAFAGLSGNNDTLPVIRHEAHFSREYRRAMREFRTYRAERRAREKENFARRTEPEAA